jgi:hypothetical protein
MIPLAGESRQPTEAAQSHDVASQAAAQSQPCLGVLLGVLDREQPDLARVLRAWPTLPEPLRAAVLALVATASNAAQPAL